jgi:PAS domain S-box-containing protein
MIGRSVLECVVPGSAYPSFEAGLARLASGGPARLVRIHCATATGPRWIEAVGSGVFAADGALAGMRGVGRDVTERIATDARLAESEAKFRTVAEAVTTPILVFSGTHLRYVNAAAIALLGYAETELFAMPFWDVIHPDDRALARERGMARQRGERFPPSLDYRLVTKHGETRWVEFTAVQTEFEGTPAILGTAVDVTERKRAEAALQTSLDDLRRSEERLRRLARRHVQIREDERKRLGFDLHDGVCQELVGVAIMIHSVRDRLATSEHAGVEVLERAVAYLHTVVEHLRLLARELRPMLLQDLGLVDSLASLATGLTTPERDVAVRVVTPIPRLVDDVELAVYRIAQEALTNAVRHADARKIVAIVTCHEGELHLEMRDDGRGFDVDARGGDALGLTGMRERAIALGGRLSVASVVGEGTVVTLTCPVTQRGAPDAPITMRPLRYG